METTGLSARWMDVRCMITAATYWRPSMAPRPTLSLFLGAGALTKGVTCNTAPKTDGYAARLASAVML